jgi:hypothetical protein
VDDSARRRGATNQKMGFHRVLKLNFSMKHGGGTLLHGAAANGPAAVIPAGASVGSKSNVSFC